MYCLFLILGLTGQFDTKDFTMIRAVEQFVYEASPTRGMGVVFRYERVLPRRQCRWLRMLNANDFASREEAMYLLDEKKNEILTWRTVIWGSFPDVESVQTRSLCDLFIYKNYLCSLCEGGKFCPTCSGTGYAGKDICGDCYRIWKSKYRPPYPTWCSKCRGSGTPDPFPDFNELKEQEEGPDVLLPIANF
jgi:hypothetical protein